MILENTKNFMFSFVEIFKRALGKIQDIINSKGVLNEVINIILYTLIFILIITFILNIIKRIIGE